MRIAVDIRSLIQTKPTGINNYAEEALLAILEQDKNNQYNLFYTGLKSLTKEQEQKFSSYSNVKISHLIIPNKIINFCWVFLKWPKLDKLLAKADLFWFPNLNIFSISKKCQYIITIHDLSYLLLPETFSLKMKLWHFFLNPQKKLNAAAKIIAVSENTKKDLHQYYHISAEKIKVIYSGINHQEINSPAETDFIGKLPKKFILFLGTLEPRKNILGILQALQKIYDSEVKLVLAGPNGWLYKKIYQTVRKNKLSERVIFLGYVSYAQKQILYQKALALIWTSFYEGFGFPPLEALANGCPVITAQGSSLPEITNGQAILADPYNINDLVEAINQLTDNQQLKHNFINQSANITSVYSWANCALNHCQLFKNLL